MHESYGSLFVCVCVCVCYHASSATYLVYTLKTRCLQTSYGVLKICIVWILLKTLCSKVLATFADHLPSSLLVTNSRRTKETAMASFQED